jgi:hypothetical protein
MNTEGERNILVETIKYYLDALMELPDQEPYTENEEVQTNILKKWKVLP